MFCWRLSREKEKLKDTCHQAYGMLSKARKVGTSRQFWFPTCCWLLGLGILSVLVGQPFCCSQRLPGICSNQTELVLGLQGYSEEYMHLCKDLQNMCTCYMKLQCNDSSTTVTAMPKVQKRIPTSGSRDSLFPNRLWYTNEPCKPLPGRKQWKVPVPHVGKTTRPRQTGRGSERAPRPLLRSPYALFPFLY